MAEPDDHDTAAAHSWRFGRRSEHIASRASHLLLWSMMGTVVAIFGWAAIFEVDKVTRGAGRVIPLTENQVVQHFEGGIISDIRVREGFVVKKGEVLLVIDNQFAHAELANTQLELYAKQARLARLQAESEGREQPKFTEELMMLASEAVRDETSLFNKRLLSLQQQRSIIRDQLNQQELARQEQEARLANLEAHYEILARQVSMLDRLFKSRAGAEKDLLSAQADAQSLFTTIKEVEFSIPKTRATIAELQNRESELVIRTRAKAEEELTEVRTEIKQLQEEQLALQDRISRSDVRSPIEGTINKLLVNTIGGVVQPGQALVEIVPLDDSIIVEAKIRPADRAEIWPGLPALVKISAYDYSVYGGLKGTVTDISADAITDDNGEPYFRVRLEAETSSFGPDKPVIPGMTATVDILGGRHTILNYILTPAYKVREYAFRQ